MKPKSADHHRRWVLRLFEWGVITCVIGLLCGLLLNRAGQAQAAIERQNFLTTVRAMQAAVLLQSILQPGAVAPGSNPAAVYHDQFGMLPAGYLGELNRPDPAAVTAGCWYFDAGEQRLVYRVRNARYFQSNLNGPPRIRMQLVGRHGSNRLRIEMLDDGGWTIGEQPPAK